MVVHACRPLRMGQRVRSEKDPGALPARASIAFAGKTTSKMMTRGSRAQICTQQSSRKQFETENDLYIHSWPFRCPECDLPCRSATGVKIHVAKARGRNDMTAETAESFKGSLGDKAVRERKLEDQHELLPKILCEGETLDNVFKFCYLARQRLCSGRPSSIRYQDPDRYDYDALWKTKPHV